VLLLLFAVVFVWGIGSGLGGERWWSEYTLYSQRIQYYFTCSRKKIWNIHTKCCNAQIYSSNL